MKAFNLAIGGTLALTLGAGAAVRTLDLGSLYTGTMPPSLDGASGKGPLFTITFEDGADASVKGGVDITLRAVGLDSEGSIAASGWWLNFDSPSKVGASDLALSYKVLGEFGLTSYQLADDGVAGAGGGYGNFDIGITFDDLKGGFTQGDSLQLTFMSEGRTLSNTDFFGLETSTEQGSTAISTAVRLARYVNGKDGGVTHGLLNTADLTASSSVFPSFPGGGEVLAQGWSGTCDEIVAAWGGMPTQVAAESWGFTSPFSKDSERPLMYQLLVDYNCPEPSSVMAGVSVTLLGAAGWVRRRRQSK